MALSYTSFHTGVITSNVMKMASDVRTWLGGNCCVPNACRSKPSTTTMRTKLVVISRIAGRQAEHGQQQHHLKRRAHALGTSPRVRPALQELVRRRRQRWLKLLGRTIATRYQCQNQQRERRSQAPSNGEFLTATSHKCNGTVFTITAGQRQVDGAFHVVSVSLTTESRSVLQLAQAPCRTVALAPC